MNVTNDPLASLMVQPASPGKLAAVGNEGTTKDQFLHLLVEELKHQDPLNPQKGADFVSQLAQFSSLEAAADTNKQLADIATGQLAAQRASLAGFIGKTISARTDRITLTGQGAPPLTAHLDGAASKVQLVVRNLSGGVVRTINLNSLSAGDAPVAWDGKDDGGRAVAAGQYQLELKATTAGGADVSGYIQVRGAVSGLEFAADGPHFRVGGVSVSPSDITSING